jgi:hypothetical protein
MVTGSHVAASSDTARTMTTAEIDVHTEEVTGSIPVSPTQVKGHFPASGVAFLLPVQQ